MWLTVDLEDWFQVYNFHKVIKYEDWDKQEFRLERNTKKLLNIFEKHNKKATFFVLGWNADKIPHLIGEIKDKGHEIASHGYNHKPIFLMSQEKFEKDIILSQKAIKKACNVKVKGYRAPSFSIRKDTLWALDILKKNGFEYDSSMVPVKHPDYGIKCPNRPFTIKGMQERPITTTFGLPTGGGYFRIYPLFLTKFLLKHNRYPTFYIHPWEIDPNIPKYNLPLLKRFRHYHNLKKTEKRLKKVF